MPSEYQSGRGPHFSMVPWELQDDPAVDAWMIAVYAAVRRFADFGRGTGSFVSDRRGAEVAGCSERTFRDRREKLRRLGWIGWQSREGKSNLYTVHNSPVKPTPAGDAGVPTPAADADPTPAGDADDREPSFTESYPGR